MPEQLRAISVSGISATGIRRSCLPSAARPFWAMHTDSLPAVTLTNSNVRAKPSKTTSIDGVSTQIGSSKGKSDTPSVIIDDEALRNNRGVETGAKWEVLEICPIWLVPSADLSGRVP